MTRIEIMDALARMEDDEQRYAHKLLCRAFAGRALYTVEKLPKLVELIKRQDGSEAKIRKNLMTRFNDRELVNEIMVMCSLGEIKPTKDMLLSIIRSFDGWFSIGELCGVYDTGYVSSMLDDMCMDDVLEDRIGDGDVREWRVK